MIFESDRFDVVEPTVSAFLGCTRVGIFIDAHPRLLAAQLIVLLLGEADHSGICNWQCLHSLKGENRNISVRGLIVQSRARHVSGVDDQTKAVLSTQLVDAD